MAGRVMDRDAALEDESFMSAADLRAYMTKMQLARAADLSEGADQAEKARQELIEQMSDPIDLTPVRVQEIVTSLKSKLRSAAENNRTDLMVMRFPNALCTDKGRAINNSEAGWPETLIGRPRQAYEIWREHLAPLGFKLTAMIIDWPQGLPGDVGFFLDWGEKKR
jgi:hypothetical protein